MDDVGAEVESTHQEARSFPVDVGVLLGVFVVVLFYFQYTTLAKFQTLKPAVRFVLSREALNYIHDQAGLTIGDAMVFFFIASLFLYGVILEIWKKRLTHLLRWVFAVEQRAIVALVLLSVVCVRYYFAQGVLNWSGDGSSHICYAWLASQSFAQGEIPIWTNYLGGGSPYLQFYGFLFFYAVGLLDQLIGDLDVTMKLILASAHVLSGIGTYFFVRRLTGSRPAAFVAGLAYVLCLWHTQQVLVMGRFPLSLFYALLPWPFYAFERVRLGQLGSVIWGGITLGALAFVHPGYGFWATAALGCYGAIRIALGRTRLTKSLLVKYGIGLWGLGIVFGAYLTIPMWVERANVELEEITHSNVPDPTWGQLFVWSNYRVQLFDFANSDHWYGGYLGLSLVLVALIGIALGGRQRRLRAVVWAGAACLGVSLILVLGYRWPGISSLDLVKAFNAGRYLLFVSFFLAVMAGVGAWVLMRSYPSKAMTIVTWVLLVVLMDLGLTTFQHPFVPENETFLVLPDSFYETLNQGKGDLSAGKIPNFRLSYPMDNMFDLLGIAWFTVNMGIPSYLTGYREGLPAQSKFCGPVQDLMNRIFEAGTVAGDLNNYPDVDYLFLGMYLLNTDRTYVLMSDPQELVDVTWPYRSPIVAAPEVRVHPNLVQDDRVTRLKQIIQGMQVNVRTHTCEAIYIDDDQGVDDLGTTPEIELLSHQVWNQRVVYDVRVTEPAFVRLVYAHYPYLGVYVNGEEVKSYRTAGGFVALKLDAGSHQIELRPYLSPLRRFFLWIDILIVLGSVAWWWRQRKILQKKLDMVPVF